MKKQITVCFIASILITGLVLMGRFMARESDLSQNSLTENSRSQLELMTDLLISELDHLKSQLARTASLMEAGQSEEAQKQLQSFIGVAALDPESGSFLWQVQTRPSNKEGILKDEWASPLLAKIIQNSESTSDLHFSSVQTAEGRIRSALTVLAKVRDRKSGNISEVKIIGLTNGPLFQDLLDKLKAQGVHVFLTTAGGLTLAHTVSEYVGNSMVGDATFENIRKSKSSFGTLSSKDIRGDQILSFYVKLPVGNLLLVSQWRKSVWLTTDWAFYGQMIFLLVALSMLFGWWAHRALQKIKEGERVEIPVERVVERIVEKFVERPTDYRADYRTDSRTDARTDARTDGRSDNRNDQFSSSPGGFKTSALESNPSSSAFASPTPTSTSTPAPLLSSSLVTKTIRSQESMIPMVPLKVVAKVIEALKAPLLSVLGQVQIARLNPQGGALQVIETEVRNAQDVIDRLDDYCGQSQVPSITVPLHEIVEAALRHVEGAILRGNIKIIREIPADLAIRCDIDDLKKALAALFRNSIEAMEKSYRKNLTVRALRQNQTITFEIEDTGDGILPENLEKIYDPFFTTRSPLDHKGLGLSMVKGVIRQHQFEMNILSQIGEGTRIKIQMPLSQEVVHSLSERGLSTRKIKELSTPSMDLLAASEEGKTLFQFQQDLSLDEDVRESMDLQDHDQVSVNPISPHQSPAGENQNASDALGNWNSVLSFIDGDDDEGDGDFQFGRMELSDPLAPAPAPVLKSRTFQSGDSLLAQKVSPLNQNSSTVELSNLTLSQNPSTLAQKASTLVLSQPNQPYQPNEANQPNEPYEPNQHKESAPSSSLLKRLKKKDEPLASMKVQIPRPEERL